MKNSHKAIGIVKEDLQAGGNTAQQVSVVIYKSLCCLSILSRSVSDFIPTP